MRLYNKAIIAAAFTEVSRLERENKPIVWSKLGLNWPCMDKFKKAITHNFTREKHGFDLHRIFILDEKGNIHRNTSPSKNPGDSSLIDLIIKAMCYIGHNEHIEKENEKAKYKIANPTQLTDEFLINELKTRGYVIFKVV